MHDSKARIAEYFADSARKQGEPARINVTLEHFVTDEHTAAAPPEATEKLLRQMGAGKDNVALSCGPAGQLRIACGPYDEVGMVRLDLDEAHHDVNALLARDGLRFVNVGYHPTAKAGDLPLARDQRTALLSAHLAGAGERAAQFLRASAATNVAVDYYSADDCVRKMRIASALAPAFMLLCDSAAAFEGAARPHQVMRAELSACDPDRSGTLPGVFGDGFSLEDYADYLLKLPAVYTLDASGKPQACSAPLGEALADSDPRPADIDEAVRLTFNDVRLNGGVEICAADSMPVPFVVAYAALVKGLFCFDGNLDQLDELTAGVDEAAVAAAKAAIMQEGYGADLYGKPAGDLIEHLIGMARDVLSQSDRICLMPLTQMARKRTTLATLGEKR